MTLWSGADTLHPKVVERSREELRVGIQVRKRFFSSFFCCRGWETSWIHPNILGKDPNDVGSKGDNWKGTCQTTGSHSHRSPAMSWLRSTKTLSNLTKRTRSVKRDTGYNAAITRNHDSRQRQCGQLGAWSWGKLKHEAQFWTLLLPGQLPSSAFVTTYYIIFVNRDFKDSRSRRCPKKVYTQLLELEESKEPLRPAGPLLPPKPLKRDTADTSQVFDIRSRLQ